MPPSADRNSIYQDWLADHHGIIAKVTRSFASTLTDSADLQQELLLQLWISIPAFTGQAKPSTWIYRVCLNTALMWRRTTVRRERRFQPGVDPAQLVAHASSPAETAGHREVVAQLYAAIHAMPDFERALVLLSLDGVAYREIAEVTGLSENHVGVALTRARRRLASLMKGVIDEME